MSLGSDLNVISRVNEGLDEVMTRFNMGCQAEDHRSINILSEY